MLYRALYSSRAVHPRGHISDLDILRTAQTFNTANDLTGFLFRSNTHFFQVLEGEKHVVHPLLTAITHDVRHTDINMHLNTPATGRVFGNWAMGYGDLSSAHGAHVHSYLSASALSTPDALGTLRNISQEYA